MQATSVGRAGPKASDRAARPLRADELERDLAAGGLPPSDDADANPETHLPASEQEMLDTPGSDATRPLEAGLMRRPPG